ncbi:unnamed protein product [Closterium sp. NIES-65]|nr:unnamed protein product [Closterium sp. NIES-65]
MAGARGGRNGRGGGKAGGKVIDTAGNTPPSSTEQSPGKSPLVSAQASPRAPLASAVNDVLGEAAKISLQERLSALKDNGLKDNNEGSETQQPQPSTSADPSAPVSTVPVMVASCNIMDEDECWDSDDEDVFDPAAVSLLASQVSFSLTLLIPIQWESEVRNLKPMVIAHLDHWKASLTADAQTTTTYQEMLPAWLSKKRYGRLQVTFQHESDAISVWQRVIEHDVGKGITLKLNWQHPENATYKKERQQNPDAVEVLLKSVPAGVTPELVRKMLTEVVLLKKGKPAFSKGVAFHRVQDPVTGIDTDKRNSIRFCELNINGLGSAGKQEKCKNWLRNKADIAVLTDTRLQADHYFWTQMKPAAVVAVGPPGSAGGVAVVSLVPGMTFTDTYTHASGRLVAVVVRWGDLELLLVAMYLPAQPENRAPFYRDCLGPFLGTLPTLSNVMVMGDMNVVEDPALDKSSGVGSSAENRRLLSYWAGRPLTDAFRYLHPGKREYTFHMKAKGVSTRIDRALVSQPLLCKLVDVRHADITNKMTDHWSAVVVALESSAAIEKGPGIWRLRAVQAKKRGVRRRVEKVIMDAGGDLGGMLPRLSACLRAYTKEERKRIGATMKHLEKEVRVFRQRLSQNPQCQRTGAILLKKEELLNAYEKSHQEKLQEWLGLKAELDGEATTGFLSGKIKERKARTEVKSVCYNGTTHSGAREVLTAATEYFRNSFGGGDTDSHGTEPQVMDRVLCDASRRALGAPWSEEEVRAAVRELAPGKSPGQDGLPKELFEHNWDLLGPVLMQFIESFTRTAKLPREVSTAVTILLHKKGSKEELGNYRPITLLSTVYKVLAKVLASRLKKVLHEVISEDQAGFLPGRRLADAVAVVADAIEAGASDEKDWYLLMVDFQNAFDSISRAFLFRTLRGMGVPERFVSWAEGLHTGAGTRLHINGWTGERVAVEKGVRQGCPLAPYLFLCAVEPLCQDIARRRLGVGEEGAVKLAYLGYADDTSLVLQGEEQLVAAADVLEKFGKASGLKVNKDKTVVFPLGRNRGKSPPSDLQFKWADTAVPERLLGVWITPNGDPLPSWEKALDRARKELAKWEIQHLTTSARVTIINGYITPIFMFQAYIYPPPEEIWTKVKRICHHFVSGGEATEEKAFVLWNYELVCTPREEGGLGMICPKKRFDSIAVQNVGRMMLQTNPVKKWLTERAAAMPLGPDTIYAHQSLQKHWEEGSKRWKDMTLAFWKSPFCVTPEPSNRWEAEREQLAFNRRIPFRGASPFGNQQGSAKLLGVTLGDLVWRRADGSRELKCVETLTSELGSVDTAKLALKAFMAAPAGWRDMILATLTSEELVAKVPLLRYQGCISAAPSLWKVSGAVSGRVTGVACRESKDGTFTVGDGKYPVNFGLHSGEPVAAQGDKVLGLMGEARTKLLQSKLTKDGGILALKEIRKELVTSAGIVKEQRRWIGDGRIIEWERVIKQRDSLATPARAREILLRLHCRNLQVGERLFFMNDKVVCPHCKAEETPEHCLLGCPAIQRIVRFLKKGLAEMNPQLSWQGLEDLLFMQRSTKSGFPESSFIATILHQTWLARCDASRCGVALQPKKVIRLAVVKFVAHARVYCLARQMAARKHGVVVGADNWDYLATDEAAVMRRICSKGAPLTWRNNFSSIWNDPKMTNRPP